ncbi:hypothetical protein GWI33_017505 [Rhynchophorus ferrugineus]|uniref:Uncharacterized protein n=1 Tax=Rhynchophorus ferrugineus TaxID=354439 RepID=A0A834HWL1_RHYFE|nr:hypothetical protein GWI33_017505 [Rhynchophorus ferrugineus]
MSIRELKVPYKKKKTVANHRGPSLTKKRRSWRIDGIKINENKKKEKNAPSPLSCRSFVLATRPKQSDTTTQRSVPRSGHRRRTRTRRGGEDTGEGASGFLHTRIRGLLPPLREMDEKQQEIPDEFKLDFFASKKLLRCGRCCTSSKQRTELMVTASGNDRSLGVKIQIERI